MSPTLIHIHLAAAVHAARVDPRRRPASTARNRWVGATPRDADSRRTVR